MAGFFKRIKNDWLILQESVDDPADQADTDHGAHDAKADGHQRG